MKKIILFIFLGFDFGFAQIIPTINLFSDATTGDGIENNSTFNDKNITNKLYNENIKNDLKVGTQISIRLPEYKAELNITSIDKVSDDEYYFSAKSSNNFDVMYLSKGKNGLIGNINTSKYSYSLVLNTDNNLSITRDTLESFIDHDDNYTENVNESFLNNVNDKNNVAKKLNNPIVFTVLIAYTQHFANELNNNLDNIKEYMRNLENVTNEVYKNSHSNIRMKIVYYYKTKIREHLSYIVDLRYINALVKPEYTRFSNLRNQYFADIQIFLRGGNGLCGRAKEIGAKEYTATAVVLGKCAIRNYSLAHEIGHLFGARHIYSEDSSTVPYAYGHGYCDPNAKNWRSVMAYNCPNGDGARIPWLSNPNISYYGSRLGSEELEFNAKVHNVRAEEVAGFRDVVIPEIPAQFSFSILSDTSVRLSWLDGNDEIGYKIYQDNQLIATLSKNSTTYTILNINPKKDYGYRIEAYNHVVSSPSSSISFNLSKIALAWMIPVIYYPMLMVQ